MDNFELHRYILDQIEYYMNAKENELDLNRVRPLYLWLAATKYQHKHLQLNERQKYAIIAQVKKLNFEEITSGMLKFEQIMAELHAVTGNEVFIIALNIFKEYEIIRTIETVINVRKDSSSSSGTLPKNRLFQMITSFKQPYHSIMRSFNLPTVNVMTKIKRSTPFSVTKQILNK